MGAFDHVPRHKLSVEDYHKMGEAGILTEDSRVELIEGELIDMAPIGSEHAGAVNRLTHRFVAAVGDSAIVQVQGPLRLGDRSEPQPDVLVLRPRADYYSGAVATAADVLLAVEVADSSLGLDQSTKIPLYAAHGIPEVWIVDLRNRLLSVYRDPGDAVYRNVQTTATASRIQLSQLPGVAVDVTGLL